MKTCQSTLKEMQHKQRAKLKYWLLKALAEFKAKKDCENLRLLVILEKIYLGRKKKLLLTSFIHETISTKSSTKYVYPKLFIIKLFTKQHKRNISYQQLLVKASKMH